MVVTEFEVIVHCTNNPESAPRQAEPARVSHAGLHANLQNSLRK